MNRHRPNFYRRIRLFCEISIGDVSLATGVTEGRITAIETGRRQPNDTERRLVESFLCDKLMAIIEAEGPAPEWIGRKSSSGSLTKQVEVAYAQPHDRF